MDYKNDRLFSDLKNVSFSVKAKTLPYLPNAKISTLNIKNFITMFFKFSLNQNTYMTAMDTYFFRLADKYKDVFHQVTFWRMHLIAELYKYHTVLNGHNLAEVLESRARHFWKYEQSDRD